MEPLLKLTLFVWKINFPDVDQQASFLTLKEFYLARNLRSRCDSVKIFCERLRGKNLEKVNFFVQSRSTSKPCFSLSGVEHRSQRPRVNFFLLRTDPLFDHLLSFTLFIFRAKNQLLLFSATKLARFGGKLMMTQQVFSLTKRVNFLHKNIFYLAMDSCFCVGVRSCFGFSS